MNPIILLEKKYTLELYFTLVLAFIRFLRYENKVLYIYILRLHNIYPFVNCKRKCTRSLKMLQILLILL